MQHKNEYLFFSMFCLGTLVLRLFYIMKGNGPFVYEDELGYWSHAAHMAGYTWAGLGAVYAVIREESAAEISGISYESCLEDEGYLVILCR